MYNVIVFSQDPVLQGETTWWILIISAVQHFLDWSEIWRESGQILFCSVLKIETKNTVKLIKKMDKPQKTRYNKDMPPSKKLKTKQKYCYQQEQKLQAYNYTIPVNN